MSNDFLRGLCQTFTLVDNLCTGLGSLQSQVNKHSICDDFLFFSFFLSERLRPDSGKKASESDDDGKWYNWSMKYLDCKVHCHRIKQTIPQLLTGTVMKVI